MVLPQRSPPVCPAWNPGDRVQHEFASGLSYAARRAVADRHHEADEDDEVDVWDGVDRGECGAKTGCDSGVQTGEMNRRQKGRPKGALFVGPPSALERIPHRELHVVADVAREVVWAARARGGIEGVDRHRLADR